TKQSLDNSMAFSRYPRWTFTYDSMSLLRKADQGAKVCLILASSANTPIDIDNLDLNK
ncbi:hypothetical protein GGU11DRAFT_664755, partial [Lentinula aff. detonsa]